MLALKKELASMKKETHAAAGEEKAERIAWATVNKESGGGKLSGSGRHQTSDQRSAAAKNWNDFGCFTRHAKPRD